MVAALRTVGKPYKTAQELHALLKASAIEKQKIPPVNQLKDLVVALERKIACSEFAESLLGWNAWVRTESSGLQDLFVKSYEPQENMEAYTNVASSPDRGANLILASQRPRAPTVTEQDGETFVEIDFATPNPRPLSFRDSLSPPATSIAEILRALSQMERVGEADFTIIRAPASMAVWIIVFVKWCVGVEPSLCRHSDEGTNHKNITIFHRSKSKVTLEISAYDSRDFSVRCFKRVNNMEELLWNTESRLGLAYAQSQPWAGMARVRPYLLARVQDLQQYFGIYHIVDTLTVLASDFTENFRSANLRGGRFKASPFPPAERVLQLLSNLFPSEKKGTRVSPDLETVRKFWRNLRQNNVDRLNRMSELFMEVMVISLIENAYDDNLRFYIDTRDKRFRDIMPETCRNISWFLSGEEQVGDLTSVVPSVTIIRALFREMLGCTAPLTRPLASSQLGQVGYLSFLDSLLLGNQPVHTLRIFSGSLFYEGQRYSSIRSEDNTSFEAVLYSKVHPQDYLTASMAVSLSTGTDAWQCGLQDDYLDLYYIPYVDGDISISPDLMFEAYENLIFLRGCRDTCVNNEAFAPDLLYCRTIAAALSPSMMQILRVLSCSDDPKALLVIQLALTEYILDREAEEDGQNMIVVVRGLSCLACACQTSLDILKELNPGRSLDSTRAIILA